MVLRNPRLSHFFVYCSGVRCPKYQTILGATVAKSMIGLPIDARGFWSRERNSFPRALTARNSSMQTRPFGTNSPSHGQWGNFRVLFNRFLSKYIVHYSCLCFISQNPPKVVNRTQPVINEKWKKKHEDNESKSLKKKENELRTIFYAG